jgi:hypothetical protein
MRNPPEMVMSALNEDTRITTPAVRRFTADARVDLQRL